MWWRGRSGKGRRRGLQAERVVRGRDAGGLVVVFGCCRDGFEGEDEEGGVEEYGQVALGLVGGCAIAVAAYVEKR